MPDLVIAQRGPYETSLKAGRKYFWCRCGRSAKQPFCDGSHAGTGFEPVAIEAAAADTVFLCGCKHTGNQPYCDGTHNSL